MVFLRFSFFVLLLLLLVWAGALFGYVGYIEHLDAGGKKQLAKQPAQSIVVLTGGVQRIALGRDLLLAGAAPKLFISGVGEGVRLQDILPNLPLAVSSRIYLGREADDTLGNAREIEQWLGRGSKVQYRRVVMVTGHYHLPRALWHLASRMPEVEWIPIAARPEALLLDRWYLNPLGWQLLSSELAKFFMQMVGR